MGPPKKHGPKTPRPAKEVVERASGALIGWFHMLALFAIGGAIVWSAVFTFIAMIHQGHATVGDILLLFIYLELGAMVGIYFKTNHMPVRFLIYVAMTALTRMLIGFINVEPRPDEGILVISGAILLLSIAILVLRYGSSKFPSSAAAQDRSDIADAYKTT